MVSAIGWTGYKMKFIQLTDVREMAHGAKCLVNMDNVTSVIPVAHPDPINRVSPRVTGSKINFINGPPEGILVEESPDMIDHLIKLCR